MVGREVAVSILIYRREGEQGRAKSRPTRASEAVQVRSTRGNKLLALIHPR